MTFPKLSGFIHFSKTFPGLENAVLKFHDFSRFFMTVRTLYLLLELCDGPQVGLHVGAAVLQQSDLVLDDVWIADVFQLLWVECRQLFFWSSIDGVQRQPAGLKHRTVSREKTKCTGQYRLIYRPPRRRANQGWSGSRRGDGQHTAQESNPVQNYCMSEISCLHDAVIFCFDKAFRVNSSLLVLYL